MNLWLLLWNNDRSFFQSGHKTHTKRERIALLIENILCQLSGCENEKWLEHKMCGVTQVQMKLKVIISCNLQGVNAKSRRNARANHSNFPKCGQPFVGVNVKWMNWMNCLVQSARGQQRKTPVSKLNLVIYEHFAWLVAKFNIQIP